MHISLQFLLKSNFSYDSMYFFLCNEYATMQVKVFWELKQKTPRSAKQANISMWMHLFRCKSDQHLTTMAMLMNVEHNSRVFGTVFVLTKYDLTATTTFYALH